MSNIRQILIYIVNPEGSVEHYTMISIRYAMKLIYRTFSNY